VSIFLDTLQVERHVVEESPGDFDSISISVRQDIPWQASIGK
jgi:hypothetical protein